jgi:cysteine desulfurase
MFNLFKKNNFGIKNRIYFDSASSVPVLDIAKNKFLQTIEKSFANAASIHNEGEEAKEILFEARKKVAKFLHAKSSDIYFASSTTEANNIFIKGIILSCKNEQTEIIYSKSDHSAIVDVVEASKLLKENTNLINIIPNKIGLLKVEDICNSLTEKTKLICFSYVSSELGTIQEVRKIVLAVRDYWDKNISPYPVGGVKNYPKIFVDATQATKYENMDISTLLVDGLSFSGSKIGSIPGCSVLFVKNDTKIVPIISGGGQEEGVRSGTENLAAISALGEVLESMGGGSAAAQGREKIYELRNYAIEKLKSNFNESELEIFGDTKFKYNKFFEHSAPHILLISLVDMLGEETLLRLDAKGISVSTASACSLLENSGSSFLKSIGEPIKAKETIRLSLSESNTKAEIDYFVETLRDIKNKFIK